MSKTSINEYNYEDLETWLSGKPYWEQYVWKLNFEKDTLSAEDIEKCYQYLSEDIGLEDATSDDRQTITFKNEAVVVPESADGLLKIKILEIKDFEEVNALNKDCSIKCSPSLTLVYGENGSGKSGVGRLLCNACFSRGEREILPNVRITLSTESRAKATFIIDGGSGEQDEINYVAGDDNENLRRFSVFDSKSVLIHLDQSNSVRFIPAQIKIFDKVTETMSQLEKILANEASKRRKESPFKSMFNGEHSAVAEFCQGINASTTGESFVKIADFNDGEGLRLEELQKQIEGKKKLDVLGVKSKLKMDCANLRAMNKVMQCFADQLEEKQAKEINKLTSDILEHKKIVEDISIGTFNTEFFSTVGSPEWKSLIGTAKVLYENEKISRNHDALKYCVLCHQKLSEDANTLFQEYWRFLESKAESELRNLLKRRDDTLQNLKELQTMLPKFCDTDAGVAVLQEDYPMLLAKLKQQFIAVSAILGNWISRVENIENVDWQEVPQIPLVEIETLCIAKTTEEEKLKDPSEEIASMSAELLNLEHKRELTRRKKECLDYIEFLKWSDRAGRVSFSGIRGGITRKRTDFFNIGIASNYKGMFNDELNRLGYDFDLVMYTSGEQGNTVKEYKLDFADGYTPSQILSEGEQNACSLADFLTEVQLDKNNCGIILDDPVSSLDHLRKENIAERLVNEAQCRQVIIFTHDKVFLAYLARYAEELGIDTVAHWMRIIQGVPGCVESNVSPKLTTLSILKEKSRAAIKDYESRTAEEQEIAFGIALDFLRSACEALIEEKLFARTIQRWDDHIRVNNLEEAIFDQDLALKILALFGRISEVALMHNRSDMLSEGASDLESYNKLWKDFEEVENKANQARKTAKDARDGRKREKMSTKIGW